MSLIDGIILHTLDQPNHVSEHSMLMRFYELDKSIKAAYGESYKKAFHSASVYFMQIEAVAILYTLKIK